MHVSRVVFVFACALVALGASSGVEAVRERSSPLAALAPLVSPLASPPVVPTPPVLPPVAPVPAPVVPVPAPVAPAPVVPAPVSPVPVPAPVPVVPAPVAPIQPPVVPAPVPVPVQPLPFPFPFPMPAPAVLPPPKPLPPLIPGKPHRPVPQPKVPPHGPSPFPAVKYQKPLPEFPTRASPPCPDCATSKDQTGTQTSGPIDQYPLLPAAGPLTPGCVKEADAGDQVSSNGNGGGVDGPWIPSDSGLPSPGENQNPDDDGAAFQSNLATRPEDVEDCVACRYIWLQVEQEVGNSQVENDIYTAFSDKCKDAAEAAIFFPACNDMHNQADDMIGDYMDGYTVNQLCENARLCR